MNEFKRQFYVRRGRKKILRERLEKYQSEYPYIPIETIAPGILDKVPDQPSYYSMTHEELVDAVKRLFFGIRPRPQAFLPRQALKPKLFTPNMEYRPVQVIKPDDPIEKLAEKKGLTRVVQHPAKWVDEDGNYYVWGGDEMGGFMQVKMKFTGDTTPKLIVHEESGTLIDAHNEAMRKIMKEKGWL